MLDLTTLPAFYLSTYGRQKVAEVTGESISVLSMWNKRGRFSLSALQRLLEFDPSPLSIVQPLYTNPEPGKDLIILMPLSGPPKPKTLDTLIKLYDRAQMDFQRFDFNSVSVSRNQLAAHFLRGPWRWAFWLDGDSLCPAGDAKWFKMASDDPDMPDAFAAINTIFRLLVHKKSIMSSCYVSRRRRGIPQFGGGHSTDMRNLVRRGPQNKVIEVPWCGFGGVLTHRDVFLDIIKTQGDEIRMNKAMHPADSVLNYEYAFFHPLDINTPGDDVPFCHRAAKAGHKSHIDLAVMTAHIGDRPYTYKDVAA